VPAGSVAVTTGSSGGFLLAFLAAFDPGDTVVMARPGYPAYRNMLAALGCTVLELAGSQRPSRFQLGEQVGAELGVGRHPLTDTARPHGVAGRPDGHDGSVDGEVGGWIR